MATSRLKRKLLAPCIGLVLVLLGVLLPKAIRATDLQFITSRAELGSTVSVDWAVVGPGFIAVANPFTVKSSDDLDLTVTKEFGGFSTSRQSSASDGPFSANFAPGDALITTTRQNTGPVTITFSSAVSGVGTQVESFNNGPFNATIEALDSEGDILGSFSVPATAIYGGRGDNTAPFVGVLSYSANIASIRINGERAPGVGFAFNRLDIVTTPISSQPEEPQPEEPQPEEPQPEFSSVSVIAIGGFLGAGFLWKRQRNKSPGVKVGIK